MEIQVAIQCHFFQKRLCWMLSSILQQEPLDGDRVSVSIAHVKGTGDPTVDEVADLFRFRGLDVSLRPYPDTRDFQYRGWTRNEQLNACEADWILFADSDMVYPPDFFPKAFELLRKEPYVNSSKCLFSGRFSTTLEETDRLVDGLAYPCLVDDAFQRTVDLPGKLMPNIGAGYCHLVNVPLLKNSSEPYYCPPGKKIDNSWDRFAKAKSDQHFRRRVGKLRIPLPVQYHLQHVRDNELGKHVEIQR